LDEFSHWAFQPHPANDAQSKQFFAAAHVAAGAAAGAATSHGLQKFLCHQLLERC
jgi:hypothetical protein